MRALLLALVRYIYYDYNSKKRLGHVTSPESNMAETDVSISHCTDFVFRSISTRF